jgi:hypothetical protein
MAICRAVAAGVTFVVAAGNSHVDEMNFTPANDPEVLTVTSVSDSDGLPGGVGGTVSCQGDGDDTPANYTNYATRAVEDAHTIAAPGSCIRSTYPNNMYATMSGTSMASPHVAGLVALCMGENGAHGPCWGKPPAQVVQMMIDASNTTAAQATASVFTGGPARPVVGRYYGNLASTAFPSGAGAVPALGATIPAVSGTAASGATLTTTNGTWSGSGITYTYEWLRCTTSSASTCSEIAGATARTYVLGSADVGKNVRSRVIATNNAGGSMAGANPTATIAAPAPLPPAGTGAPVVTGTAATGQTLTGDYGSWTGTPPMRYLAQWQRCTTSNVSSCASISGATRLTYAVTNADRGKQIRLMITTSNAKGTAVQRSAATASVAGVDPPAITGYPTINGSIAAGSIAAGTTLTAGPGTWSGSPTAYAYQWLRCPGATPTGCASISGATRTTMVAASADRGKYLRVQIRATNSAGSTVEWSSAMRIT